MASDPSIYAQLGKGVTPMANPLVQQQEGLKLQAQMAQVTAGRAYQQAIDPATGQLDTNRLLGALQQAPGGGLAIPTVLQNLQARQKMQFDLNKQQLEQTQARTNVVNGALNPLMAMGGNVTPQAIFSTMAGLRASGFNTDEAVADAAATLPVKTPGMSDQQYGQSLAAWVTNHAARSWGADTQATQFTPRVAYQNVGGQMVPVDLNSRTNPGLVGSTPLTMGLTPGEQSDQVPGPIGPNGEKTVMTRAQYAQQNGLGGLVQGGAPNGGPSPFANGGRLPPALMNPNRPGGAAQPGAAPAPGSIGAGSPGYAPASPATPAASPVAPVVYNPRAPLSRADERFPPPGAAQGQPVPQQVSVQPAAPAFGAPAQPGTAPSQYGAPMVVGMGPGQTAGATAAADASSKQWAALQSSVGGSAGRLYQLHSALGDLQALGQTGTGPSAGTLNNVRSYLQSIPVIGQSLGIDPNQVANFDTANKYLQQYAAARAGAHGGTTDQQLATTLSSNASTHISNLAAQDVVRANIGLERMDQAQLAGFQNGLDPVTGQPTGQQLTPDQFADYSSKWNTANDARAFVADKLTPQQFGTMLSSMSPGDQAKFQATFNRGISQGFIDPPSWMQPQGSASTGASAAPVAQPSPAAATTQSAAAPSAVAAPYVMNQAAQPAIVGGP